MFPGRVALGAEIAPQAPFARTRARAPLLEQYQMSTPFGGSRRQDGSRTSSREPGQCGSVMSRLTALLCQTQADFQHVQAFRAYRVVTY